MSVKVYLTLECLAAVPGCSSERCRCLCHRSPLSHGTPGAHLTTFQIDLEGTWPEVGQSRFHEQWLIAEWARRLTAAGGRPLGIPSVWVDLLVFGITNECPPDSADKMGRLHGMSPGDPATWHAEGPAERLSADDVSGK